MANWFEEVVNRLGNELGRAATEQELADELEMSLQQFQQLLGELDGLDLGSLQTESSQEGGVENLCEYLPGNPEESPYSLCLRSEMKDLLVTAISGLPQNEQQVLALYYQEELTMKEVGAVLRVGESRISQIHSLAIVHLRARLQHLLAMRAGLKTSIAATEIACKSF